MNTETEQTKETVTLDSTIERLNKFCDSLEMVDSKLIKMLSDLDEVKGSFDRINKMIDSVENK